MLPVVINYAGQLYDIELAAATNHPTYFLRKSVGSVALRFSRRWGQRISPLSSFSSRVNKPKYRTQQPVIPWPTSLLPPKSVAASGLLQSRRTTPWPATTWLQCSTGGRRRRGFIAAPVSSLEHRWPATWLHCSAGGFIGAPVADDEGFIAAPMKLHCSRGGAPTTRTTLHCSRSGAPTTRTTLHCSPGRASLERRRQRRMLLRSTRQSWWKRRRSTRR